MWQRISILCLALLPLMAIWPTSAQSPVNTTRLDQFIHEQMEINRVPGLALAVTQGDKIVYIQGYGEGITAQTQFMIASLSKSFTALAIMQLVDAGQIELDAPVKSYLIDFTLADPSAASQITVRQLLNQVSGLADTGFPDSQLPQPSTLQERVASLRDARLIDPPGTKYHYFNPNYAVLARLVEITSGIPFSSYLQTHVFAPLKMTHSFNAVTSTEAMQRAEQLAPTYLLPYGLPVSAREMSGYLAGSGGVVSTVEDMAHFLIMQSTDGRYEGAMLVTPESLTLMHTPPDGIDSPYAMGWMRASEDGRAVIEHNGILSVFYAEQVLLPDTGQGFVLLYNANSLPSTLFAFPQIKQGLIALLLGQPLPSGGFTVTYWSIAAALVTLLGAILALRSLVQLPRWMRRHRGTPAWRLLPGIGLTFLPALVLVFLPQLSSLGNDRAYSAEQLFRFALAVTTWLGVCAVLGVVNGLVRVTFLLRRSKA